MEPDNRKRSLSRVSMGMLHPFGDKLPVPFLHKMISVRGDEIPFPLDDDIDLLSVRMGVKGRRRTRWKSSQTSNKLIRIVQLLVDE